MPVSNVSGKQQAVPNLPVYYQSESIVEPESHSINIDAEEAPSSSQLKLGCSSVIASLKSNIAISDTCLYPYLDSTRSIQSLEAFKKALRHHVKWVWPAIFTGLLLHDFIEYLAYPNNRYGNTIAKMLTGLSTNQLTWSAHLGSDAAGSLYYWLAPALIAALPVLSGGAAAIYRQLFWNTSNIVIMDSAESPYHSNIKKNLHLLVNVLPEGKITEAEFAVLYDKNLPVSDKKELFGKLTNLAANTSGKIPWIAQLRALNALANIAGSFKLENINLMAFDNSELRLVPVNEADLQEIPIQAKTTLKRLADTDNNISAHYLLWMLGEKPLNSLSQLFWLTKLTVLSYTVYANLRFIELLYIKVTGKFIFDRAKAACESQQKQWLYDAEQGNYSCTVCGDWNDVPVSEQTTGQGCLDATLRYARPARDIIQRLARILLQPDIAAIDLSQQPWPRWDYQEWTAFFYHFQAANITRLQRLNLSTAAPFPIEAIKIVRLADFISNKTIASITLNNLQMGAGNLQRLVPGFRNAAIAQLELSGNALQEEGAESLIDNLSKMQLTDLTLDANQLGETTALQLAAALPGSQLKRLGLGNNKITEKGYAALFSALYNHTLDFLDISSQPLSIASVEALGKILKASAIRQLKAANTGLDDNKIHVLAPYFREAHFLQSIDFSENKIGNRGVSDIFSHLSETAITQLSLAKNYFTESGLENIQKYLPVTHIHKLDLSDNQMGNKAFSRFAASLKDTQLEFLIAARCNLDDSVLADFERLFLNSSMPLTSLDLSANQLTSRGLIPFLTSLQATNLQILRLAENKAGPEIARVLPALLTNTSQLIELDLRYNQLDNAAAKALANRLPDCVLQRLLLDGNSNIGDEGGKAIALALIKPLPNPRCYEQEAISIDEARALAAAGSNTHLTELGLSNTGLGQESLTLLCRFQPQSNLSYPALHLTDNPGTKASYAHCRIFSPSRQGAAPSAYSLLAFALPVVQLLMLIYIFYRIAAPAVSWVSNRIYRFFDNNTNDSKSMPEKNPADPNIRINL